MLEKLIEASEKEVIRHKTERDMAKRFEAAIKTLPNYENAGEELKANPVKIEVARNSSGMDVIVFRHTHWPKEPVVQLLNDLLGNDLHWTQDMDVYDANFKEVAQVDALYTPHPQMTEWNGFHILVLGADYVGMGHC